MSLLKQVITGVKARPHFVLLYGVDGVGKSTFGADAPSPIFLGPEDGLGMIDAPHFPTPKTWSDVKSAVETLIVEDHDYKTLVIDSIDWIEPLLWAYLIKEDGCRSIEQVAGGFGKGYVQAREHWQEFIRSLQRLRKKMNIVAIAHCLIKTTEDPYEGERYDRYLVKMNDKAADIWREAVDCVFFANFQTSFSKEKGARKAKAQGDGKRVMFTERRPAFDAKNRFDLPFEMELSWSDFAAAAAKALPSTAETEDKVSKLFKGIEDAATAYLISIEWLDEGQPLETLRAVNRKKILSRPDAFVAAVKSYAEKGESNTNTNEEENA